MYLLREYYEYGYVYNGKTVWSLLGIERFETFEDAMGFIRKKRENGLFHVARYTRERTAFGSWS